MINKKLKSFILENKKGFTIDLKDNKIITPKYKKGFYVGITNNSNANIDLLISRVLYLKQVTFKDISTFIGGWSNEGLFYLDLSLYVKNFKDAVILGKKFNQKSIYSIFKNDCINLK